LTTPIVITYDRIFYELMWSQMNEMLTNCPEFGFLVSNLDGASRILDATLQLIHTKNARKLYTGKCLIKFTQ